MKILTKIKTFLFVIMYLFIITFTFLPTDISFASDGDNNSQSVITSSSINTPSSGLNVFFFPLGYDTGETYESFIISYNDIQILVDAGASYRNSNPKSSDIITDNLKKIMGEDEILEYVIATHSDSDHLAGFSTKGENGVFDYCLKNDIKVETLIDFDITQDDTVQIENKNEYYSLSSSTGNETIYGRYVSARNKLVSNGTKYYTASQCCWQYRNIDKPDNAPDSNIFVLDDGVLTLEILYNYYYDHKYNPQNKPSSMDRNVLSVCFMLTYKTNDEVKTFLFTGDLEEFDSASGLEDEPYTDSDVGEDDDYDEDENIDDLEGLDYSETVYGESKLWEYLISDKRQNFLKSNSSYIYYDINKGVTFYKAAHHGSRTSNSKGFIDNIKPCYVVIPCVAGSAQYTSKTDDQFPAKVVMNRLFKYTDYIYITELATPNGELKATDYYGNIHFNCYAGEIVVTTSNNQDVLIQYTDWYKENRYAPLSVYSFSSVESNTNAYVGNSTLVKYGHTDILIDCGVYGTFGNNAMLTTCFIDKIKNYCVDGVLEYVVVTSASPTSLQQMVNLTSYTQNEKGVLEFFKILNLIDYGTINDPTQSAKKSLYKAYNEKKSELNLVDADKKTGSDNNKAYYYSAPKYSGKTIQILDDLSITILNNEYYQKDNNYDVCLTINHLDKRMLFTGNITKEAEEKLINNNDLSNIVYYKTSFFGYDGSNSKQLLNTIKNDRLYVVINSIASVNLFGYQTLSKATCDRIINSSSKHFSYLTAEYKNGEFKQVCGDIIFTLYLRDNEIKYSLKGTNSSQRLIDTDYYNNLR